MVYHYPAKFGCHRHCGSEDVIFSVAKGQDFTCPRQSIITAYLQSKLHDRPSRTKFQRT